MKLKKYLNALLYFFISLISLLLIASIFYYFDLFSSQVMKYLKIIILLISCLISGFYIGYNSQNKGYLNGLKISAIIIILFFILNILISKIHISIIIYYIIIGIVTTLGSMLGINKKQEK